MCSYFPQKIYDDTIHDVTQKTHETSMLTVPLPPAQSMPKRHETVPLAACTVVGTGHAAQGMPFRGMPCAKCLQP